MGIHILAGESPETDELLERAGAGDVLAVDTLFERDRERLRKMIAVRMDPRLAARLDPSDVVQEALAEAARRLPHYLLHKPLSFYPWLRQIAWERLVHLHTRHLAKKRSVEREEPREWELSDHSVQRLARRLASPPSSPSQRALREEMRDRVRTALNQLSPNDREVLVLRYLEQLPFKEIAEVQDLTESGVKARHRRALERLVRVLESEPEEQ